MGGSETKTTTYSYKQQWCGSPVDSSSFHDPGHDNVNSFPEATDYTVHAQNVQLGACRLNEGQIEDIKGATPIKPTEITIPEHLKGRAVVHNNYICVGRPVNTPGTVTINPGNPLCPLPMRLPPFCQI